MSYLLILPNSEQNVPESLQTLVQQHVAANDNSYADVFNTLNRLNPPAYIFGTAKTPAAYWLAATSAFPAAKPVIGDGQHFHQVKDATVLEQTSLSAAHTPPSAAAVTTRAQAKTKQVEATQAATKQPQIKPAKTNQPATKQAATEPPQPVQQPRDDKKQSVSKPKPAQDQHCSVMSDAKLVAEARIKASYLGCSTADYERHNDNCLAEAVRREANTPGISKRVKTALRQGKTIRELFVRDVQPKVSSFEFKQFLADYLTKINSSLGENVAKGIDKLATKELRFKQGKRAQSSAKRSTLKPIQISEHHPNSLRHLQPANQWDVYIDETGERFENALSRGQKGTVGKLIALAIPHYSKNTLAPLPRHHATTADPKVNDNAIRALLNTQCGIVGFSSADSMNHNYSSWFSGVSVLMQWVLKLLPLEADKPNPTKVTFHIENRGDYTAKYDLTPVIDVLTAELLEVDYARFSKLKFAAKLVDKNAQDDLHAYVDTVAHMWGSSSRDSKERLKASKMQGHCLLNATKNDMLRLYNELDNVENIDAQSWYSLLPALANEPDLSLATSLLNALGKHVQAHPALWHSYLQRVQQSLRDKTFALDDLCTQLSWLDKYRPAAAQIPDMLKLHWASAQLVVANHQGLHHNDVQTIFSTCQRLGQQLRVESARDVCEIDLRIATAYSNSMQFEQMRNAISRWQEPSMQVLGLKVYGKLLSTVGQHYAFTQQYALADETFVKAIAAFEQLSDRQEAVREIAQTRCYQLHNHLGAGDLSAAELESALSDYTVLIEQSRDINTVAKQVAGHAQHVYLHAVLLKAFCRYPAHFAQAIDAYLGQSKNWANGDNHPWGLINFYRAWLLHRAGNRDLANHAMQRLAEIYGQAENGVTLKWLYRVLAVASSAFAAVPTFADAMDSEEVNNAIPQAYQATLQQWLETDNANTNAFALLNACLPFNFH